MTLLDCERLKGLHGQPLQRDHATVNMASVQKSASRRLTGNCIFIASALKHISNLLAKSTVVFMLLIMLD